MNLQNESPALIGAHVWTLKIDHRHGTNLTVHSSKAAAEAALFSYVSEWWEQEMKDAKMPGDPAEAVSEYFEKVEDELADIEQATIES